MTKEKTILAGDIGASKTLLALYSGNQEFSTPFKECIYPSGEYNGLIPMLDDFLSGIDRPVDSAAFGVAGPVIDQRVQITKLPWSIATAEIVHYLDTPNVFLLNDLVANAHGLACLKTTDLILLNSSAIAHNAPKAMLSPGTGLGEAFFIENLPFSYGSRL